jgi:hypothetical protein
VCATAWLNSSDEELSVPKAEVAKKEKRAPKKKPKLYEVKMGHENSVHNPPASVHATGTPQAD